MPTSYFDRIPVPNLQVYVALSVLLTSSTVYYAIQMTSQPDWRNVNNSTNADIIGSNGVAVGMDNHSNNNNGNHNGESEIGRSRLGDVISYMVQEYICIWTSVNFLFCCLILVVRLIVRMVFGELRVSEQQHVKDKFWNFVFYKFIFIFGVLNVQFMDEVILWCAWFSVLGFLHILAQLSKDRFEYLSFSPTTPRMMHVKLLLLLVIILGLSSALYVICILVGLHAGLNIFAFMAAECILLNIQTLYVILRYAIHLYDTNLEGTWENRGTYVYYTELVFELVALVVEFAHHLHMLVWGNIFLSMASLVICMQLRCLFREMQRRINKHKSFLRVVRHLENNFSMATGEELKSNSDDCAICWDKMELARKLPCGHLFHNSCLRSWLEQDTSCPTCRTSLADRGDVATNVQNDGQNVDGQVQQERQTTNHFFHFDGPRYVSWLPSFSVEVTHLQFANGRQHAAQTSQLDNMARQVHQLFPNIQLAIIVDDLRVTRSVEQTIENVLDGRLVPHPFQTHATSRSSPVRIRDRVQVSESRERPIDVSEESDSEMVFGDGDAQLSNSSDFDEPLNSTGGRFSKSARERETMLAMRKEELIKLAKRRYLAKQSATESPGSLRQRTYEAARRRTHRKDGPT